MEKQYQYNSVEEALEELRQGRIVLVTDDPDRERADLHTDECSAGRTAWAFTDGLRKYR